MDTVGKRLLKLIESERLNLKQFAEKYSLTYTSFNQITLDKRELGVNTLRKLVEAIPDLDANWILFGTGSMKRYKNVYSESGVIEEPITSYSDPLSELILQAMENKRVEKKINQMIENKLEEMKFNFQLSEHGSEFGNRLEAIMKRESAKLQTDHKLTTKKPKDV